MIENYKNILTNKYANFSGRATRTEYWLFFLVNFIIGTFITSLLIPISIIANERNSSLAAIATMGIMGLLSLYGLVIFIPSLAVAVRRLHDTGQSGWLLLLSLIPCQIGSLILLIFYCIDSDMNANQYGPNPKNQMSRNTSVGI